MARAQNRKAGSGAGAGAHDSRARAGDRSRDGAVKDKRARSRRN